MNILVDRGGGVGTRPREGEGGCLHRKHHLGHEATRSTGHTAKAHAHRLHTSLRSPTCGKLLRGVVIPPTRELCVQRRCSKAMAGKGILVHGPGTRSLDLPIPRSNGPHVHVHVLLHWYRAHSRRHRRYLPARRLGLCMPCLGSRQEKACAGRAGCSHYPPPPRSLGVSCSPFTVSGGPLPSLPRRPGRSKEFTLACGLALLSRNVPLSYHNMWLSASYARFSSWDTTRRSSKSL